MKKLQILLALAAVFALNARAAETKVTSPDGRIAVTINDNNNRASYSVTLDGKDFILPSALGLETSIGDYTQGLTMGEAKVEPIRNEYVARNLKKSYIDYKANRLVVPFSKDGKQVFDVTFQVSNTDVAFRYTIFPQREAKVCVIKRETTGFVIPTGSTTFLCPQSGPMSGFARTSPSYETHYTADDQMGKNGWGEGYTFPCLFRNGDNGWLLISETGTDGGYCGCRLLNEKDNQYAIGFPQEGENNGIGSITPAMALPGSTPWRTITVGAGLAPIIETTVATDLVEPKYFPSKQYEYTKGSWSWIIKMDPSCNFDEQKRYIDFSAAMGWQTVLVDALWDAQIGYPKMEELAAYGREKGVSLYLWYNSNGSWNDAPQSPLHKMNTSANRRKEMAWMQKNGIKGIKVDFFGGDKQQTLQLYEDILTDANDFGLLVIFHGCTLPRGWDRMFPNFAAAEAVRASENLHFSQGECDIEAFNGCLYPFTRNTVAAMDFGGSTLNKYYGANNDRGSQRRTSDVYALASAVMFQSPVQHFALAPNNLTDAPAWAVDFMKYVPTEWDEVRFIDGYPGKYVILARRQADRWYIAGANAQKETLKKKVKLPMLVAGDELTIYADDANLAGSVKKAKLAKNQEVEITIPCNGGVVILADAKMGQMPIIQTKYTADPAPMVWNDTIFLYTTHDEDDATGYGFKMFDWLLYTSTDMVNWTEHGAVASLRSFDWYDKDNGAWAECVVERNGKFYMYCPIHGNGIGVLVADSPYGPFRDPIGKPLVWQREHWYDIDPSVWIDDDGQAYMYWGNPNLYYVKLNEDMVSYSGKIEQCETPEFYQEGPWFYKRNGNYYMAFASTCCPEGIGYAMSDKPTGPWKTAGHIMPRTVRTRGNHPGIIDYKGKSYVFGLNYDLLRLETPNHHERRSVSASEMKYRADGTIEQISYFKDTKLEQIHPFNPYRRVEAETMAWGLGLKTKKLHSGAIVVNNVDRGETLMVQGVDFGKKGAKKITASVASAKGGSTIEVHLDNDHGPLVGTINVDATGSNEQFKTFESSLSGATGVHNLVFKFVGEAKEDLLDFDWWKVE